MNLLELQEKKVKAQKSLFRIELVFIAILLAPMHLAINYYYPNNSGTGIGLLLVIIGIIKLVIHFFAITKLNSSENFSCAGV